MKCGKLPPLEQRKNHKQTIQQVLGCVTHINQAPEFKKSNHWKENRGERPFRLGSKLSYKNNSPGGQTKMSNDRFCNILTVLMIILLSILNGENSIETSRMRSPHPSGTLGSRIYHRLNWTSSRVLRYSCTAITSWSRYF